jgi:YidC/Oxa1 family membrane protein insertase
MERRVLIAIFLSFLVLYGYQALFVKPTPKPPLHSTAGLATPSTTEGAAAEPAAPATVPEPLSAPSGGASVVLGDTVERDIAIETKTVIAVITNRGARLKSWRLKRYLDQKGEPLELIANDLATTHPLPFSLRVDDEDSATKTLNSALYHLNDTPPQSQTIAAPTRLTFEFRDAAGVHATKEFTFEPATYLLTFRASVEVGERALRPAVEWGPALGDVDAGSGRYAVKARALVSVADQVTRSAAADVVKQPTHEGDFQFVGVDDHYFMTTAISPGRSQVTFQPVSIPSPAVSKEPPRDLMAFSLRLGREDGVKFYIGPKDFDQLAAIDRPLVRAIDFGYFAFVVVPLLRALNWIHGFTGNYGWAIIILTIAINAAMFPLRHKSVVSMRRMQEIQPEAKAIQDRYAKLKSTDPAKQKMNQELMALYRERGVNPASGCVPMLLTFPVLFAFYALLTTAIELRGAPFFGWIHDLSLPDPFYVTPVLMGISQIWQTRITPQAGTDPTQQKLMMFMPVMFMFFFLWAPAGVAVYWLISNVWGIGQQYLTSYLIGPPNIRSPRPPAERRVKRVGAGKTEAAAREN